MKKKQLMLRATQFSLILIISISLGYLDDNIVQGIVTGVFVGIGFTIIGPIVFKKMEKRG